jgi:hypothetical protein
LPQINLINPPRGRFYADPFIINEGGNNYIFIEDYSYKEEKGRISYIETKDFVSFSDAIPIIENKYHMSYPFITKHKDNYYCIPEQHNSNEIVLYKSESFPNKWKKHKTLVEDFGGIDPTIFYFNNRWWMFAGNQKDNGSSKLYLFYADNIEGPWQHHKSNPVKIFHKMTRPAGVVFNHKGKLIRPAQNCSNTYGGSTLFYEISILSVNDYKENLIGELIPNPQSPYPSGLHHISHYKNITIVDGKRWI